VNGAAVRKSLETVNWEAAGRIIREWEERGIERGATSVKDACDRFIAYAEASYFKPATIGKYKLLFEELKTEFKKLDEMTTASLSEYREGWECGQVTARGKIGRLRAFFNFCAERGWVRKNPAAGMKLPKEKFRPKIPYSKAELEKVEWGIDMYPKQGRYGDGQKDRLRAFLLVLKYTGLRVKDVCLLRPSHIENGKIMLYQSKTGLPVWIPVPKVVNEAVGKMGETGEYLFWSGEGNIRSCIGDWQRSLKILSRISGVHIFCHRYRTNLAIELLSNGVSLDKVAMILGNSVKIVEKHYAPFTKLRQEELSAAVQRVWA
jgi:integrase